MEPIPELENVLRLLGQEKEHEIERHRSFIEKAPVPKRVSEGVCWFPLFFHETGYGLGDRPFIIVSNEAAKERPHQFQGGQTVRVFSEHPRNEGEQCNGVIHYVDGNRMKVTLYADEHPDWFDLGRIGVDLLLDLNSYKEMELAVHSAMQASNNRLAQLRDILYGEKPASFLEVEHPGISNHLNPSQTEAVAHVLQADDVALIHGPPGTGKTTTLVEAIRLLAGRGEQVLVCAASNAATDLLTNRTAAVGLKVVRIGNLSRIDDELLSHTLEGLISNHAQYKQIRQLKKRADEFRRMAGKYKRKFGPEERNQRKALYKEARELGKEAVALEDHLIEQLLDDADVITCTLTGSATKRLKDRTFATLIVDEAAQALEPATWIPMQRANKVVLAGDPLQLPPTVKSDNAARGGLSVTLLEKALKQCEKSVILRTQYRMNERIMAFPNQELYGGQLEADNSVANWHTGDEIPVEFVDTAGCGFDEEQQESKSFTNPGEADVLFQHLNQLLESKPDIRNIGIISPYKEQVIHLRERLGSGAVDGGEDIHIAAQTIDSFQGQERDVIYLSLVRSNEEAKIGFLADVRRMNVAMTRARKKLVVIGDSATIANNKFYNNFITFVENEALYRSAWEFIS